MITLEIVLFIIGIGLGVQGFHRIWKPKYKLVPSKEEPKRKKSLERRKSSVIINAADNSGYIDDQELAKEAVALLSITEEDTEVPDLLLS